MSEPHPPALFDGMFDDAAIFPPGNAPMPEAVRGHGRHRASWYRDTVGPFVCSAARLDELAAELDSRDANDFAVSLTVPDEIAALQHAIGAASIARLRLSAVEVPLGAFGPDQVARSLGALAAGRAPTGYLEVPPGELTTELAAAIRAAGLRLKLRTGGTSPPAFPSEAALAGALAAAAGAGLSFKCTAGLHHAVRHRDPVTGFEHHGFLNVLLAVRAARTGDVGATRDALATQDRAGIAAAARDLTAAEAGAVRRLFVSFGTCSITDPVDDLRALGLVSKP